MARILALMVGLALLVPSSGVASARPAGNQQAINEVIARALAQRGVPYTYGGGDASGPTLGAKKNDDPLGLDPGANVVGFDASGLIVYAYAGVGMKLPRSSGQQYLAAVKVAPSQALPGDLIFYGPDGEQSVTLYLGNGQMLEATDPAVTVSPVRTANMTPYLGRILE